MISIAFMFLSIGLTLTALRAAIVARELNDEGFAGPSTMAVWMTAIFAALSLLLAFCAGRFGW